MYEPGPVIFIVDFGGAALLLLAYLVALAVIVHVRSPGGRGLAGAVEALASLARGIDLRRAAMALGAIVALLTGLGALVAYSASDALHVYIFRLNDERTVPTSFNALQLLVTATIALLLAWESRGRTHLAWTAFAFAFFFGAIDEAADVHARFEARTGLPEEIALLPLGLLVISALVVLWPQLRASKPALPVLFGAGAAILVSQGFDLIHARWSQRIVEEALELAAGSLFVLALLIVLQAAVDVGATTRHTTPTPRAGGKAAPEQSLRSHA